MTFFLLLLLTKWSSNKFNAHQYYQKCSLYTFCKIQNKLQNILLILIIIYKEFLVYIQRCCLYIKRDNSYCLINEVSNQNVLDITLCDKVCYCLAAGRWFLRELRFPLPIKLKVALNTITLSLY
jgi:hypothetical protein